MKLITTTLLVQQITTNRSYKNSKCYMAISYSQGR